MVLVKRQIVPTNLANRVSYGQHNNKRFVTVHQTGNPNRGANAQAHSNIQLNGNPRQASWHETVDDKEAIVNFGDGWSLWHCGDGRGNGNMNSYGIEICINSDGDYKKSVENGAKRAAAKLKEFGRTVDNGLRMHWDWNRKNCPMQIRNGQAGINWNEFKRMVQAYLDDEEPDKVIASSNEPTGNGKNIDDVEKGLDVNGVFFGNAELIRALQRHFGTQQTGQISAPGQTSQLILAMQRFYGSKQTGNVTRNGGKSLLFEAMQRYHGTEVTGRISNSNSMLIKEIQRQLNDGSYPQRASGGKSVEQMAQEVLAGDHGDRHTQRRQSLGVSQAVYEQVRTRVNQLA